MSSNYVRLAEHARVMFVAADAALLAAPVRWTPRWAARDVLAHLVANAERAAADENRPPTDADAHAAVVARREATVSELAAELPRLAAMAELSAAGPSQEWDIAVHLADVREVWGRPELPEALWRPVLVGALAFLEAIGDLDATLVAPGDTWGSGPEVRVVSDYELFRALFGRRADALDAVVTAGDPGRLAELAFFA